MSDVGQMRTFRRKADVISIPAMTTSTADATDVLEIEPQKRKLAINFATSFSVAIIGLWLVFARGPLVDQAHGILRWLGVAALLGFGFLSWAFYTMLTGPCPIIVLDNAGIRLLNYSNLRIKWSRVIGARVEREGRGRRALYVLLQEAEDLPSSLRWWGVTINSRGCQIKIWDLMSHIPLEALESEVNSRVLKASGQS